MASRGKTVQLNNMFVADFETCDAEKVYKLDARTGKEIKHQKVWLAGFKNLETMESTYFYSLDEFMEAILSRGNNVNTEYAFHNIKFDGSYIIPWLLTNSYTVSLGRPQAGEFSVLVDKAKAWDSITIQVTKRRKVLLWDSQKLFPCALEYLPDVYSTPTQKVREDSEFYERVRPDGYIPDAREMGYFENDLQVPAEALNEHIKLFDLRFKKTQASQSFYNFEQGFGDWKGFKHWKFRFPALTTDEDKSIRPAYWGGIALVPAVKAAKKGKEDYYNIGVMDINSSYPDKAANKKLPYGRCVAAYGEGQHPNMSKFWVAEALVEFTLKENCLPCIPSAAISEGRPKETDKWMTDSEGIVRLRFSNIDYGTMQLSYDIKVWRWCWSMHWAWKVQKEVADFVYMNNDNKVKFSKLAKLETDPHKKVYYNTMRNRAKTDNNAFYGKFGEDIVKEGKTPYWENEDVIWRLDRSEEQNENKRKFLPVAMAITAWGRRQLVTLANILGEDFLYCDTDSVHYLLTGQWKIDLAAEKGIIKVDAEELGAWKLEGKAARGRYLRAKCYMEEMIDEKTGKTHIEATVAGLPADKHSGQFSKKRSCLNWDNFYIGHEVPAEKTNKLRTVKTPTGNKLLPTHFKLREKEVLFG